MAKTNTGLVAYCEQALTEKWFYGWGAYGQKATAALVDSLVKQYPGVNTGWKDYMTKAVSAGTRLADCYGLVKGYLFQQSSGGLKYDATLDINSTTAYTRAKEKGALSTMPETPGVILHMPGHVGVYCGNGRFIECVGGGIGIRQGKMEKGKVTNGSAFINWFKDTNIDYSTAPSQPIVIKEPETPKIEVREIPMLIGVKEVSIHSIFHEGHNYVNLRDFADAVGLTVESNPYEDIPIISQDVLIEALPTDRMVMDSDD